MFSDVDFDFGGEGHLDAVCFCDLGEVSMGSAVDVADADDMAAGRETLQDDGGGSGAGGECEGVFGVLEGCDGFLEVLAVGVRGATVFVCADGFSDCGLREGGGEGDGLDDGAGGRVVRGSGVDGESTEAVDWRGCSWRSINWVVVVCHSFRFEVLEVFGGVDGGADQIFFVVTKWKFVSCPLLL